MLLPARRFRTSPRAKRSRLTAVERRGSGNGEHTVERKTSVSTFGETASNPVGGAVRRSGYRPAPVDSPARYGAASTSPSPGLQLARRELPQVVLDSQGRGYRGSVSRVHPGVEFRECRLTGTLFGGDHDRWSAVDLPEQAA